MGPATTGMPAETNVVGSVAGAVVYESAFAAA
jgi:hypothetical protein